MKRLSIYVDASVIGGCEDEEFARDTLALWRRFSEGSAVQVLSEHTLRELAGAPVKVRAHLESVPKESQIILPDSDEAAELAQAYLNRGIVGPGSRADALHVALATVGRVDVLVSWNFKHVVNFGRIRLFNAVNLEQGYGLIEIRTPREVLDNEKDI
ncbi:MAG: PIN domain protein [Elusimicrobia bacterium]|nr:PIN domain protein [Elusimicrobiota bacterium]